MCSSSRNKEIPIRTLGTKPPIWKGEYGFAAFDGILEALKEAFSTYYLIRDIPQILSQIHRPKLSLRHDVFYSPEKAVEMAEKERNAGLKASFMVALHSPYYHLSRLGIAPLFRAIADMGHEIGLLHPGENTAPSAKAYPESLQAEIKSQIEELQDLLGVPVHTAAFQIPFSLVPPRSLFFAGKINASAPLMMKWTLTDDFPEWTAEQLIPSSTKPYEALLQVILHPGYWGSRHCDPRERIKKYPLVPRETQPI